MTMARSFLDSNIIVYANDSRDPEKQDRALACLERHIREGTGVISTQVLQEYASVAVQKLKQAVPIILQQLYLLESLHVVTVVPALVRRAVEFRELYSLSFWDSLILATAESAGCGEILTEDLNPGQIYCGIRCVNPLLP
jgi:predicted nucleic acid-binding protein